MIAVCVLLRILSNPLGNVYQKQLTAKGHNPLLVNFLTYFFLSVGCVVGYWGLPTPHLYTGFWGYSLLGGVVGAMGNALLVKALDKGELSVLGPINAYKSVIGMLAGIFVLHEIPNIWGILGIITIIYGSYFVLDSTTEKFSWKLFQKKEIQFRIGAMILTAIEAVFVKKVIQASSPPIAFISWSVCGAFFSFILLGFSNTDLKKSLTTLNPSIFCKYLLLTICVGTMQFTTNYTFKHISVGYALALFQLSAIVSVWLGHTVFQEQGIGKKLLGAIIMVVGSLMILLLRNFP